MEDEKYVDESWKDAVSSEKANKADSPSAEGSAPVTGEGEEAEYGQLNFLNYLSSLVFQAMIFLGDMPNPISNQTEKNLRQAKFLIDTLALLREKTKGNLTKQEEDLLNGSLYELQMRYVEVFNQEGQEGKT